MEDAATEALDAPIALTAVADPGDGADPADEPGAQAPRRSADAAQQLVLELVAAHADSLLRTARRYSLCADDAQDAYQRGLEILMRHAHRLDADRAGGWLHTVVKREAMAINRSRRRFVGGEEVDLDAVETRTSPSPEEHVLGFERVARSAEALQRLKPQEVRALWLKAMGNSYQEICDQTGWTYTKVNRCLAEGRKSFLARYAGIEAGEECERWAPVLSSMVDGEATAQEMLDIRPHLRNCAGCRAALRELRGSTAPLTALFPVGGGRAGRRRARPDRGGGRRARAPVARAVGRPERARGDRGDAGAVDDERVPAGKGGRDGRLGARGCRRRVRGGGGAPAAAAVGAPRQGPVAGGGAADDGGAHGHGLGTRARGGPARARADDAAGEARAAREGASARGRACGAADDDDDRRAAIGAAGSHKTDPRHDDAAAGGDAVSGAAAACACAGDQARAGRRDGR
jgi:RNA polymerase sigma factor (sigma-70 family)